MMTFKNKPADGLRGLKKNGRFDLNAGGYV
jgi:hypothetical protein